VEELPLPPAQPQTRLIFVKTKSNDEKSAKNQNETNLFIQTNDALKSIRRKIMLRQNFCD
jgi:hypothetical protein